MTLEDGSKRKTARAEKVFIIKIGEGQYIWLNLAGRVCVGKSKDIFSRSVNSIQDRILVL